MKPEKIKFSICIPNYNGAVYLKQTIDSIMEQSYDFFEIVISDNASTDNSVEIIKSYNSDKINLIQQNYNIGYSHNLDSATINAKGDYFIFLGADDLLKPDALQEFNNLINLYDDNDLGIIICAQSEIIQNGKSIGLKNSKGGEIDKILKLKNRINISKENPLVQSYPGKEIFKILMTTNFTTPGPVQSTCYSNKLFEKVNGYHSPTVLFPDASFAHKICFYTPLIIYYEKPLSSIRIQDVSFTGDINKLRNIKLLTDKYILSLEFSESQLNKVGLKRVHLQYAFINRFCSKNALINLYSGRLNKFYRYFLFGFVSYPKIMFQIPRTYVIFVLALFSPLFYIFSIIYRKFRK